MLKTCPLNPSPSPLSLDEWTFLRFVRWHLILPLCLSTFPYNCSNDNWNHDTCLSFLSLRKRVSLWYFLKVVAMTDATHFSSAAVRTPQIVISSVNGGWRRTSLPNSSFCVFARMDSFWICSTMGSWSLDSCLSSNQCYLSSGSWSQDTPNRLLLCRNRFRLWFL